jgi:hypothetical protein
MTNVNLNPFPSDENGGRIKRFGEGEEVPDDFMLFTEEEISILEKIPQNERVEYLFYSIESELEDARKRLYEKFRDKAINSR